MTRNDRPLWRIRYGDGSTFDNRAGSHWDAPHEDVQTIVQWNPHTGREILCGVAAYYWMAQLGLWWAGDIMGYLGLKARDRDGFIQAPKFGLNSLNYQAILDATVTDADFDPAERAA